MGVITGNSFNYLATIRPMLFTTIQPYINFLFTYGIANLSIYR